MNANNNPSISYCCNGLINFSIYMAEKLVCKLECGNSLINVFSRRIDIYD